MPTILDYRGNPVVSERLKEEHGAASISSIRSPVREEVASTLTPKRLARLMRDADNGEPSQYFILADEIEERDSHYRSVKQTRSLAVTGLELTVEAASESAEDVKIADAVRMEILRNPELSALRGSMQSAIGPGFAATEIIWLRDAKMWIPETYEHREGWFFTFDDDTLTKPRLLTDDDPTYGEELEPFKWVMHMPPIRAGIPLRRGVARPASINYACKRFTVVDWMAFLDIYGIPVRLGTYNANSAKFKEELKRAVRQIGTEASAVISDDMDIKFINGAEAKGNGDLFERAAVFWDKQTSKVVLGQTMTTDDGSSLAQAKTHENTRMDIRDADALHANATLNRDVVRPFVDLNFGPRGRHGYPLVKHVVEEPEDIEKLLKSTKIFVDMGGRVAESVIRDRIGLPDPEDDELLLGVKAIENEESEPEDDDEGSEDNDVDGEGDDDNDAADSDDDPEDDEPEKDGGDKRGFVRAFDTIADIEREVLEDWEPVVQDNVGAIMSMLQAAETEEDARKLIKELMNDEGERVDIADLTEALAKWTFAARGVGDATDDNEV